MKSICIIADNEKIVWSERSFDADCTAIRDKVHSIKTGDREGREKLKKHIEEAKALAVLVKTSDYTIVPVGFSLDHFGGECLESTRSVRNFAGIIKECIYGYQVCGIYRRQEFEEWGDLAPLLTRHLLGHYYTYLLRELSFRSSKEGVHIVFQEEVLTIFVIEQGAVSYFNSFDYHTIPEAVYFILLGYHVSKSDVEVIPLWLSGRIERKSRLTDEIKKYVKNVRFLTAPECDMPEYYKFWDHLSIHRMIRLKHANN